MRQRKRFEKKVLLIQKGEYDSAMAISSYNEGRSMANVSNKTYVHGTRQFLRPDTMWADERYTNVTSEEINAAKARHEARLKAEGRLNTPLKPDVHMYDNKSAQQNVQKPLY